MLETIQIWVCFSRKYSCFNDFIKINIRYDKGIDGQLFAQIPNKKSFSLMLDLGANGQVDPSNLFHLLLWVIHFFYN